MDGYSETMQPTLIPGTTIESVSDHRRPPAPGRLELVRTFVNTTDVESGADDLTSPGALAEWLIARGLLPRGRRLTGQDLDEAITLRETLRDVLQGNAGHPVPAGAAERLDGIAAAVPLRARFAGVDGPRLEPADAGRAPATGWLLGAIYESMVEGTWSRLKVCANDTCRWAFYDSSRNRSGTWCTMAICGNRMKGKRFRRRHPARASDAG
jgi:predicted RNA-binding Zn ribbon-like protein